MAEHPLLMNNGTFQSNDVIRRGIPKMADFVESHVVLTGKIKRWIPAGLKSDSLSEDAKNELKKYVDETNSENGRKKGIIPFRLVKQLHECLKKEEAFLYLHELLEGSDVYLPKYEPPARSPELEARLEKLKSEQANKEYHDMTKNVDLKQLRTQDIGSLSVGREVKSLNRHVMAVVNFVLTVIGAFAFGYKAMEYSLHQPNITAQMCMGLIFATVVFFADLYFLIKYDV